MTPRHHQSILWAWGLHGVVLIVCGMGGFAMGLVDPQLVTDVYGDGWLGTLCLKTIFILDQAAWPLTITGIITLAATLLYLKPTYLGALIMSLMMVGQAIAIVPASLWLHQAIGLEGIGKLISAGSEIGSALMIIAGAGLSLWAMWGRRPDDSSAAAINVSTKDSTNNNTKTDASAS